MTALGQPQAISGLGGVGKTQLAVEYAYHYRQEYQAILWVQAESTESLISSYVALAELLQLPEQKVKEQEVIVQAVTTWLQTHHDWLLILDNADEPDLLPPFFPRVPGGHLLVTTRAADLSSFGLGLGHALIVQTFDPAQGAQLLLHRAGLLPANASLDHAGIQDHLIAQTLSRELGGLPLALDQAGAYLAATQIDLMTYQQVYRQHRASLLAQRGGREHPESVATTWSLSFQRVAEKNAAAADILRLCAYLFPDAIPEEIFTQGAPHLGQTLSIVAADALQFNQAIGALRAYSLVQRDPQARTLAVHHLIQAVLQDEMEEAERSCWMERALLAVNAAFPDVEHDTWSRCERLLPQALAVTERIEWYHLTHREAGRLLYATASYLQDRARYAEAEPLYERALRILEQLLGPDHAQVASPLHGLASLYHQGGRYAETEPSYKRALRIWEQQLGAEHPQVATPLHGLANLYREQGKYAKAEPLYKRVLHIREQQLGPKHPNTRIIQRNYVLFLREMGRDTEADKLEASA